MVVTSWEHGCGAGRHARVLVSSVRQVVGLSAAKGPGGSACAAWLGQHRVGGGGSCVRGPGARNGGLVYVAAVGSGWPGPVRRLVLALGSTVVGGARSGAPVLVGSSGQGSGAGCRHAPGACVAASRPQGGVGSRSASGLLRGPVVALWALSGSVKGQAG